MRIALSFKDDVAIVSLSGKFIAGSDGPFLRQKVKDLVDAGTQKLLINFAEVPYIDSTGLGFLAGTRVTAQSANVRLVLAGLNQHVMRTLESVRLTQFFTVLKDEETALAKFRETPSPAKPSRGRKKADSAADSGAGGKEAKTD